MRPWVWQRWNGADAPNGLCLLLREDGALVLGRRCDSAQSSWVDESHRPLRGIDAWMLVEPPADFRTKGEKIMGQDQLVLYASWWMLVRKEWRWKLVAPNGQVIGTSGEGYVSRDYCISMMDRMRKLDPSTPIVDENGESLEPVLRGLNFV